MITRDKAVSAFMAHFADIASGAPSKDARAEIERQIPAMLKYCMEALFSEFVMEQPAAG